MDNQVSLDNISAQIEQVPSTPHSHGSCLVIGLVYAIFYLSGALLFWMLGSTAHRYTLNYGELNRAQTLEEVRDELARIFDPTDTPLPAP